MDLVVTVRFNANLVVVLVFVGKTDVEWPLSSLKMLMQLKVVHMITKSCPSELYESALRYSEFTGILVPEFNARYLHGSSIRSK